MYKYYLSIKRDRVKGGVVLKYIIIIGLTIFAIQVISHILSGDKRSIKSQDERQKKIFRDAAVFSWETLLLYGCLHVVTFYFTHPGHVIVDGPFFQHGGDILLVGTVSYVLGFLISYFSSTKFRLDEQQ
jgi:hypothetical protein